MRRCGRSRGDLPTVFTRNHVDCHFAFVPCDIGNCLVRLPGTDDRWVGSRTARCSDGAVDNNRSLLAGDSWSDSLALYAYHDVDVSGRRILLESCFTIHLREPLRSHRERRGSISRRGARSGGNLLLWRGCCSMRSHCSGRIATAAINGRGIR